MPAALLALAVSAFSIGTTEFVIMGLLPDVAHDLDVSIPLAGLLISGYALGVVVGAPLLTVAATRLRRKQALLGLMVLFIVGNLISAVATVYEVLLAGRVVAALCHGAFFGVGSVVAADLVGPSRRARAIALMFSGLTLANVLGVPLGTALGQHLGWRSTFWTVTAMGALSLVALAVLVPAQAARPSTGVRGQLAPFRRSGTWLALAVTTLGFSGLFASFTYVAPMMTDSAGFTPASVTWLLVLFGVGLCLGNMLGGRAADRALVPTLLTLLAGLSGVLALFTMTVHHPVTAAVTLFVLGVVGFATVPPLQARVLQQAGDENILASALNIAAFNLGNAIGAYFGGLAIDAGFGYASPNLVGAALSAAGLALAIWSVTRKPRNSTVPDGQPGTVLAVAGGGSSQGSG